MKTVLDCILDVTGRFKRAKLYYGHGTDNADDEAFALVFQVLKLPFAKAQEKYATTVSPAQQKQIEKLAARRICKRMPLAYLMHEAYFMGLPFYVDHRVIIPRSPFAEVIASCFAPLVRPKKVKNVLDIGTGSGCMAIAAALKLPHARIDAVDYSKKALAVARINCKRYHVTRRVHLVYSDIWQNIQNKKYDLIISNPPYVSSREMQKLPREYCYEPKNALQAKSEGLEIIIRILQQAAKHLTKNGVLMVEVGAGRKALEKQFPKLSFTWLEFEHGGEDVFVLTRDQLKHYFS